MNLDDTLAELEPACDWRIVTRSNGGSEVHSNSCPAEATVVLRTFCICGETQIDFVCDDHIRRRPQAFVFCRECGITNRCLGQSVERWPTERPSG